MVCSSSLTPQRGVDPGRTGGPGFELGFVGARYFGRRGGKGLGLDFQILESPANLVISAGGIPFAFLVARRFVIRMKLSLNPDPYKPKGPAPASSKSSQRLFDPPLAVSKSSQSQRISHAPEAFRGAGPRCVVQIYLVGAAGTSNRFSSISTAT